MSFTALVKSIAPLLCDILFSLNRCVFIALAYMRFSQTGNDKNFIRVFFIPLLTTISVITVRVLPAARLRLSGAKARGWHSKASATGGQSRRMKTHYGNITFSNIRNAFVLEISYYILKRSQMRSY
jgi:hypothetical protein